MSEKWTPDQLSTDLEREMYEALAGVTRIVRAFSANTSLGKTQRERLERAESALRRARGEQE